MEAQKKAIIKGLESNLRSQSKLYNSAVQSRKKAETLMVESKKTLSVSDKNLLCAASKSYNAMFQNLKLAKASENEELQKLKDVGKQLTLAKKELELINHFGFGAKILVEDSEIAKVCAMVLKPYDSDTEDFTSWWLSMSQDSIEEEDLIKNSKVIAYESDPEE